MAELSKRETREKQLRLAMLRIEKGLSTNRKNSVLSVSAVAREAGVSASLIHNCYPGIALEITSRAKRASIEISDSRRCKLAVEEQLAQAKLECAELRQRVASLVSINESLRIELEHYGKLENINGGRTLKRIG